MPTTVELHEEHLRTMRKLVRNHDWENDDGYIDDECGITDQDFLQDLKKDLEKILTAAIDRLQQEALAELPEGWKPSGYQG